MSDPSPLYARLAAFDAAAALPRRAEPGGMVRNTTRTPPTLAREGRLQSEVQM